MAIRVRGKRAFLRAIVATQRRVETPDGPIFEIVLRDAGADRDELVIRTPWRGALAAFPPGAQFDIGMERVN